jgi:hypothetical protein
MSELYPWMKWDRNYQWDKVGLPEDAARLKEAETVALLMSPATVMNASEGEIESKLLDALAKTYRKKAFNETGVMPSYRQALEEVSRR